MSLVGGSSGTGKTSLMVSLLDAQRREELYLGHPGAGLPYLIIFADRGPLSNQETFLRMHLDPAHVPHTHMPVCWGPTAAQHILTAIEARFPRLPAVVFVEGADMLLEDPNHTADVAPFLSTLQGIAAHYHLALILSTGAAKSRPKDEYRLKRDRIFGSQVWARMADTVAVLAAVGDGTSEKRALDVLHRQAKAESYQLEFVNGLLVEAQPPTEGQVRDQLLTWIRDMQHFRHRDIKRAFPHLSGSRRETFLDGFENAGFIRKKAKSDPPSYAYVKGSYRG